MKKLLIMLLVSFSVVTAGAWVIETVDSEESTGYCSSLALDILDNAHISYYNNTSNTMRYAHRRWFYLADRNC